MYIPMGTDETQRDQWGLMRLRDQRRPMGTHETQRD